MLYVVLWFVIVIVCCLFGLPGLSCRTVALSHTVIRLPQLSAGCLIIIIIIYCTMVWFFVRLD